MGCLGPMIFLFPFFFFLEYKIPFMYGILGELICFVIFLALVKFLDLRRDRAAKALRSRLRARGCEERGDNPRGRES